jgi:hypothetical protein
MGVAALKGHEIPCNTIDAAPHGELAIGRQYRKLKSIIRFFDPTPTWPAAALS